MRPPRLAAALLDLFDVSEVMKGDLLEELSRGRSRIWYWRQVVSAIARHCRSELSLHWFLVIRALLLGFVVSSALGWTSRIVVTRVGGVLTDLGPARFLTSYLGFASLNLVGLFIVGTVTGLVVARFHRSQRGPAILIAAILLCYAGAPRIAFLVANSLTHERFLPYLAIEVLNVAVSIAGLVIGGGMSDRRAAQRSRPGSLTKRAM